MIIGIDPGVSGAVALYAPADGSVQVWDIPTHFIKSGPHVRATLDDLGAWRLLREVSQQARLIVFEDVRAMPGGGVRKPGVTSTFRFGEAVGVLRMAAIATEIPVELVKPRAWKRVMLCTADKDATRRRANHLLPKFAHLWARKKDHNRAEAVLLALLGHQILIGREGAGRKEVEQEGIL